MTYRIYSFGHRYGPAPTGAYAIDCRCIRNPDRVPGLRDKTGLDADVQLTVLASPGAGALVREAMRLIAQHEAIAFGCVGGRHRSVTFAETVATALRAQGHDVTVEHRDKDRPRADRWMPSDCN